MEHLEQALGKVLRRLAHDRRDPLAIRIIGASVETVNPDDGSPGGIFILTFPAEPVAE